GTLTIAGAGRIEAQDRTTDEVASAIKQAYTHGVSGRAPTTVSVSLVPVAPTTAPTATAAPSVAAGIADKRAAGTTAPAMMQTVLTKKMEQQEPREFKNAAVALHPTTQPGNLNTPAPSTQPFAYGREGQGIQIDQPTTRLVRNDRCDVVIVLQPQVSPP